MSDLNMVQKFTHRSRDIRETYRSLDRVAETMEAGTRVLFFLEDPRDVHLLKWLKKHTSADISVIVFSPAGVWELEKERISFSCAHDFFDMDVECRRGFENFEKIDRICEEIDRLFFEKNREIASYHFAIAKNYFTYLKILFDGISFRAHVIREIIDTKKPALIVTVRSGTPFFQRSGDPSPTPFSDHESLYSYILECPGWPCRSLSVVRTPAQPKNPLGKDGWSIKKMLDHSARRSISLYSFLRMMKFLGAARYTTLLPHIAINRLKNSPSLIVTSYSAEWQELVPTLVRNGYRVLFLPGLKKRVRDNAPVNVCLDTVESIQQYCNRDGFDFSALFRETSTRFLNRIASDFSDSLGDALEIFRTCHPAACIGNVESYADEKIFIFASKHHKVPKVTWQHGALGFFSAPIFIYEEYLNSDLYFVWGDGVGDMYRQILERMDPRFRLETPGRIITIGSTMLDRLYRKANTARTTYRILYCTMNYYHDAFYFGFSHRFDDITIWHAQREIITLLAGIGGPAVLKLHPSEEEDYHIEEFVRSISPGNITVVKRERGFSSLAADAEIIILDCPSTVLLEALATEKPVFVLLQFLKIYGKARELLKKRAYCCENIAEMKARLQSYLDNKPDGDTPDCSNTEFLIMYGIPKGDTSISQKAAESLMLFLH